MSLDPPHPLAYGCCHCCCRRGRDCRRVRGAAPCPRRAVGKRRTDGILLSNNSSGSEYETPNRNIHLPSSGVGKSIWHRRQATDAARRGVIGCGRSLRSVKSGDTFGIFVRVPRFDSLRSQYCACCVAFFPCRYFLAGSPEKSTDEKSFNVSIGGHHNFRGIPLTTSHSQLPIFSPAFPNVFLTLPRRSSFPFGFSFVRSASFSGIPTTIAPREE